MAAKTVGTYVATELVGVDLHAISTTKQFPLGTTTKGRDMSSTTAYGECEFMYLAGGTNVIAKSVVTINDDFTTTLIAARAIGAVAVSLGTATATDYAWFVIKGKAAAASDGVTTALPLYIDGTAGRVDDAAVAGDVVIGAKAASGDDTNTIVVNLVNYAYVGDADNA